MVLSARVEERCLSGVRAIQPMGPLPHQRSFHLHEQGGSCSLTTGAARATPHTIQQGLSQVARENTRRRWSSHLDRGPPSTVLRMALSGLATKASCTSAPRTSDMSFAETATQWYDARCGA